MCFAQNSNNYSLITSHTCHHKLLRSVLKHFITVFLVYLLFKKKQTSVPSNICNQGVLPERQQPDSMARAFLNSKIQPGKVVIFIKPTCPYCRRTQEFLSQLPLKQGPMVTSTKFKITCNSLQEPEQYLGSSLVKSRLMHRSSKYA